ncbi:MAG TPA: Uma2 family endonuclease [Saprospiraceae bacterium]|nr:Uma2 family endonuclease [Saprospiraceae bacterium]HMP25822.1 Uma2 family endonuclease [Saprospiraceae bacterium]
MKKNIAEQLLEMPNAPLVIEEVQQALAAERSLRRHFYEIVTEDQKAEFINGEIIVHSPVKKRHDNASGNLYILLKSYVTKHQLGYVGHEKLMISLTRNDYEPDICFFQQDKAAHFKEEQTTFPAPDLVVEVLSSGTHARDRGIKFQDYEAHGILEYWIVDARQQTVEQYHLQDNAYEPINTFDKKQHLQSIAVEGFTIPVKAIFDQQVFLQTLAGLLE